MNQRAAVLACVFPLAGCGGDSAPTTTSPPAAPPAPPPPPSPAPTPIWRGLAVAPEERCAPYDSDDYSYPQSVENDIVRDLEGLYSPYTCESFDSIRETDIEHIVARSEAHDPGLCGADAETRTRFARDLLNLTLASPALNRQAKVAHDAAQWLPDQNRCWFA